MWRRIRLQELQYHTGLESAYAANEAVDEIRANQEMIDQWKSPEQAMVSDATRIEAEVQEWERDKCIAELQFSAFDIAAGALIGRNAPVFERRYRDLLSGESLPRINEELAA